MADSRAAKGFSVFFNLISTKSYQPEKIRGTCASSQQLKTFDTILVPYGAAIDMKLFRFLMFGETEKKVRQPQEKIVVKQGDTPPLSVTLDPNPTTDKQFCSTIESALISSNYSQISAKMLSQAADIKRRYAEYLNKCLHLEDSVKYLSEEYSRLRILQIAMLVILLHDLDSPVKMVPQLESSTELEEAMQIVGLAHQMKNNSRLSFEWAMIALLYEARRWNHRIGVKRARSLFLLLMKNYFEQMWPEGFEVEKNPNYFHMIISYYGASYSISSILNKYFKYKNLPDPATYNWRTLIEIADYVERKIAPYARALGRNVNPVKAMLLLPSDVITTQLKSIDPSIIAWLEEMIALAKPVKIAALIEHIFGEKEVKDGAREFNEAVSLLGHLGYGVEPDVKFSRIRSTPEDVCILFSARDFENARQAVGETYAVATATVSLMAGMHAVSHDTFFENKNEWLEQLQEVFKLSDYEFRRLHAYFQCLCARKSAITASQIKKALAVMPADSSEFLASFIVSVACERSSLEKNKIAFLEKIYDVLGLTREKLYRQLHEGLALSATPATEPVSMGKPKFETSHTNTVSPIAQKMMRKKTDMTLDPTAIKAISMETDKVSSILKNIFNDSLDNESELQPIGEKSSNDPSSLFSGLEAKHEHLIKRLLLKKSWSHAEFTALARECALMPNGALEVINEWAFDGFKETFAEEDGEIEINEMIANQLKNNQELT